MNSTRAELLIVVAWFAIISPSSSEEIFCNKDSCSRLFSEDIPWGRSSERSIPRFSQVTDQIRCKRFILPYLESIRDSEWPPIRCKDIIIEKKASTNEDGFKIRHIYFRGELGEAREQTTVAFRFPHTIYSDKLFPYVPCHATSYFDSDLAGEKPYRHPYLERFPERKSFFPCSYLLPGWGAGPTSSDTRHEAAPFQPNFDAASSHEHRASTFVDESLVENASRLITLLLTDANDETLRTSICVQFGTQCVAPRLIKIEGNPHYDQAIVYCSHEVVGNVVLPPAGCLFGALRRKNNSGYLIQAMITPDTFFVTGDGIGDTDILCEKGSTDNLLSILKTKYPISQNFRISESEPLRVMRLGYISDVYPSYRENFVMRASQRGDNEVTLTPIIYFSSQNVGEQSQYRPISTIEYNAYTNKLFERLRPELVCRDARDAR
jgi:hypothetical protein